ncbi:threonine/serine dehydratase [Photobacterium halotolerans]|uniref:threonine/serine dehydratase n=1 Tax=Photobacterium halotolerans TaxID=265726 RepID=UPI000406378E|nr:threonine/serine dehydratase [Photobacterium halotolerans]
MKEIINKIKNLVDNNEFYSRCGVNETPIIYSKVLSDICQCETYLKCENLQGTGSFKIRGATSAILNLPKDKKDKGVITASSGNHGTGTSAAAKEFGIPVTVFVPSSISLLKEERIISFGSKIIKVDGDAGFSELIALQESKLQSKTYISPYNHSDVIAGQGTIGIEIMDRKPSTDVIIASVGGGGMISGIALVAKDINPNLLIIGAYPENSPVMKECIEAGEIISVQEKSTLSDGTAGQIDQGSITFDICNRYVDRHETVNEIEIASAMKLIKDHHGMIIEGAAGVAVATLIKLGDQLRGKKVCVVLCGMNVSDDAFESAMTMVS